MSVWTCLVLPYRAWLNVFEEVRSGRRGVLTLRYPKWNCPLVSEVTQLSDFLPDPKFSFEPSISLPLFHISGMKIPWLLVRVCSPTPFCPHFVLYYCRTHMCHLALTYVSLLNASSTALGHQSRDLCAPSSNYTRREYFLTSTWILWKGCNWRRLTYLLVCRTIYSTGSIKRLTVFDIRCAIFLAFSLFPEMNGYYWRILSYKFIKTIYFANMWHTKFNSIGITAKKEVKYLQIWK